MIDSQALVYHGAAAAARLHETAELAQKGSEKGRKAEEGKLWGALEGGAFKAPSPPVVFWAESRPGSCPRAEGDERGDGAGRHAAEAGRVRVQAP